LRPFIGLRLIGPAGELRFDAYLDTGSEFCLFPEWIARRIGLRQQPQSLTMPVGSSVGGAGVVAWFEAVDLQIDDPANIQPSHRWKAIVGFTPVDTFASSPIAGLLGVNGGLDQFQRIEFDWHSLAGPEVVIRT
jgi:hypothetical protein